MKELIRRSCFRAKGGDKKWRETDVDGVKESFQATRHFKAACVGDSEGGKGVTKFCGIFNFPHALVCLRYQADQQVLFPRARQRVRVSARQISLIARGSFRQRIIRS